MIRLAVRCPAPSSELVLAALLELSPAGVEQSDHGDTTEFAVYGAPGEVPDLGGEVAEIGGVRVQVSTEHLADDWAERWKTFHKPAVLAGRYRVRPPWLEPKAELEDIVIDPGRAFGTAAHPTTRLCAELLIDLAGREQPAGALLDLGTGSGVLAIIATRLGWGPVLGVDHETAALEAAAANAEANRVALELRRLDLRREEVPAAPVVLANLTADLLAIVAVAYARQAARPRRLLCSGLLSEQVAAIEAAFWDAGLVTETCREQSGWAALALRSVRG